MLRCIFKVQYGGMRTGERNCLEDSLSRFECCKRTHGDVLGNKVSG